MSICVTYICDVCRDKISTKESRDYVFCRVYSLGSSFMCMECSKIFSLAFEMTKRNLPTFSCGVCEKVFKTQTGLRLHSYKHSNDWPYHCKDCGKGFAFQSWLKNHKKSQHSKGRPYKCKFCPSTFKKKQHLTIHLLMHDERNPFACEKCNTRCESQSALDKHMLKHSDLELYKCNICRFEYRYKHNLVYHMLNFHHKSPFKS